MPILSHIALRLIPDASKDRWLATDEFDRSICAWGDSPHGALGGLLKLAGSADREPRPPVENKPVTLEEMRKQAGQSANVEQKPDCGFSIG